MDHAPDHLRLSGGPSIGGDAARRRSIQTGGHYSNSPVVQGDDGRDVRSENVTPIDAADYQRYLLDRAKQANINKARIALKRYFDWLVNRGVTDDSPVDALRPVKQGRRAPALIRHMSENKIFETVWKE